MADLLVASGAVTLANMRLSIVALGAFADFSAAGKLTPYSGCRLDIYDHASVKLSGYIKAAGTGEQVSITELSADGNFATDPGPWTKQAGWTIDTGAGKAIAATGAGAVSIYQAPATTMNGMLIKLVFDVTDWTLGDGFFARLSGLTFGTKRAGVGAGYAAYATATANNTTGLTCLDTTTGKVANFSIKQVLTPSATGVTIVNAAGAQTWISEGGSFNRNDSANYIYEIYLPSTLVMAARRRDDQGGGEWY
jgi:hypothetical protein